MRLLITILLIILSEMSLNGQIKTIVESQESFFKFQHIAKEFKNEGGIRFRGYGSGVVSDSYRDFMLEATNEDLVLLTNYPEPVVRCYAFMALVERGDTTSFHILLKHMNDKDTIEVSGCTIEKMPCASFFYKSIFNKKALLNINQIAQLDSILIFTHPMLLSFGRMNSLLHVSPLPSYYEQIRRIVTEEHDPAAAVALSKYHKKKDRIIIRKVLSKKRNAYFLDYLNKHDKEEIP